LFDINIPPPPPSDNLDSMQAKRMLKVTKIV
jgi:hypothetical protein